MRITELLDEYHIPYRQYGESPHVSEGWVGLNCPWCPNGMAAFGLGINLSSHAVNCWSCAGHSLASAIAEITGTDYRTVKSRVGGVSRDYHKPAEHTGKLIIPPGVGELGHVHRVYLASRGFDPDKLVADWKLQGIGLQAYLPWRIFIPIHDRDGRVASWTTRAASDTVAHSDRYRGAKITESAVPRGELLYGSHRARHAVVVTEGPSDVWAIGPGAVCTCGIGFSRGQVRRLAEFPYRAIVFDSEVGAQRRARELADMLAVFPGQTSVVELDAHDAATADRREIKRLRAAFLD